jgi:hypothetical protein
LVGGSVCQIVRGDQYVKLSMIYHPINGYALAVPINDLDLILDCVMVAGEMVEALNDVVRIAGGVST